jgi:hypothetical protein
MSIGEEEKEANNYAREFMNNASFILSRPKVGKGQKQKGLRKALSNVTDYRNMPNEGIA